MKSLRWVFLLLFTLSTVTTSLLANDELDELDETQAPSTDAKSNPVDTQSGGSDETLNDPRIPRYTFLRPNWGAQFAGAFKGLMPNAKEDANRTKLTELNFQLEYQPAFLQKIGILGIGPSASYFMTSGNAIEAGMFGAGGQFRYQARFFREQPIVPYVAYLVEYVSYKFTLEATRRNLIAQGPIFGGSLLLNWIERSAASDFYASWGVLRSYLLAEYRLIRGSGFDGSGFYMGVRCEF